MRVLTAEEASILSRIDEDWWVTDSERPTFDSMVESGWLVMLTDVGVDENGKYEQDYWDATDRGRLALRAHRALLASIGGVQ